MFECRMKTVVPMSNDFDQFIASDTKCGFGAAKRQNQRDLLFIGGLLTVVLLLLIPIVIIIVQNRTEINRLQHEMKVMRSELDFFKKYFPNDLMFDVHAFEQELDNKSEAKLNETHGDFVDYYDESEDNLDNSYYDELESEINENFDRSKRELSDETVDLVGKKMSEKRKTNKKTDSEHTKAMELIKSRQKRKQKLNLELSSAETPTRVEHRKYPPILAHFHGNGDGLSHYSDFSSGLYTDWTPSNWVEDLGFSHHFHFDRMNGITVKHTGIYFVYAQIYYHDQHDLNGFRVKRNHVAFMQCTTTTYSVNTTRVSKKANTCFTAAIQHLQEGDSVTIEDLGRARHTFHETAKSFFGLFRVSDWRATPAAATTTSPSPKRLSRKNL